MYQAQTQKTITNFASLLSLADGTVPNSSDECLLLVVSSTTLSAQAREALVKSGVKLGYPYQRIFFACLPFDNANAEIADHAFSLIEGLDPYALVVTDAQSVNALLSTYQKFNQTQTLTYEQNCRLLGRRCVAFENFEALLSTPELKQRAWAGLKKIGL